MNTAKNPTPPKQVKIVNLDRQMCVIRFSLDGKLLVAGGQDARVRRLDATTVDLKPLSPLLGHSGWVTALAFHPDGKRLLSADSWGRLTCWPVTEATPKPVWTIDQAHDGWLRSIAISPDGQIVATCGADGVRLGSCADGKKLHEMKDHGCEVYSVAFHPDGKSLISGDCKGVVKQWATASGKSVREIDARSMYAEMALQELGGARFMTFDAKGTTLAVAGALGAPGKGTAGPCVMLFDWASGKSTHTIKLGAPLEGYVYDVSFHPDGYLMGVLSGQPGQGKLFCVRPGEAAPFFLTALPNPHSLTVQPGFKRIIVTATNAGSNGNGRNLDKDKKYPGNFSPLYVYDLP
jgi:WD40 repeat protein